MNNLFNIFKGTKELKRGMSDVKSHKSEGGWRLNAYGVVTTEITIRLLKV